MFIEEDEMYDENIPCSKLVLQSHVSLTPKRHSRELNAKAVLVFKMRSFEVQLLGLETSDSATTCKGI